MKIVLGMMIVFVVFLVIFSVIFAFLESKPEPTIKKKMICSYFPSMILLKV